MANLHLITGYKGEEHVTSADAGSFNAAIIGSGSFVLNVGSKFAVTVVSNNTIRIADGDGIIQGRHFRLEENKYVDLAIENGVSGYQRNDLIVARYTKDASTGVENCNLVVIKGTSVTSNPVDPAYTDGDIITNHDAQADFPLYRIPIDGLNVQTPVKLFTTLDTTLSEILSALNSKVPSIRKIAGIALSANITAAALITALFSGKVVLPYDNSNLIGKTLPSSGTKGQIFLKELT